MRLLIALALPSSLLACIAMKHTDPGMPVGCYPVFDALSLDTCNEAFNYQPKMCTSATRTPYVVTCGPGQVIALIGSNYPANINLKGSASKVTCDTETRTWKILPYEAVIDVTREQAEELFGAPIKVACKPV